MLNDGGDGYEHVNVITNLDRPAVSLTSTLDEEVVVGMDTSDMIDGEERQPIHHPTTNQSISLSIHPTSSLITIDFIAKKDWWLRWICCRARPQGRSTIDRFISSPPLRTPSKLHRTWNLSASRYPPITHNALTHTHTHTHTDGGSLSTTLSDLV